MSYGNKKSINNNYFATKVQPFNLFLFFHPVHTCLRLFSPVFACLRLSYHGFLPVFACLHMVSYLSSHGLFYRTYRRSEWSFELTWWLFRQLKIEPANIEYKCESADWISDSLHVRCQSVSVVFCLHLVFLAFLTFSLQLLVPLVDLKRYISRLRLKYPTL